MRFILLGALFLSGANGLVMEIVFRRQLLLSLGVTHYSVGTVLAVFMAGLALGSFLFGRMADKTAYPVRMYGILEIGVGLAGLLLIVFLPFLDPLYAQLHQTLASEGLPGILLKSLLAGSVMLVPTVFMGGTLPVVAKAFVPKGNACGAPLGLLYGVNTLGGVAGVIGSTFWLLGTMGANITLALVSLLNLMVGIFCLAILGKKICISPPKTAPVAVKPKRGIHTLNSGLSDAAVLLVFFTSGFAALSLEVNWTRILAYVIGSHGYSFGIIISRISGRNRSRQPVACTLCRPHGPPVAVARRYPTDDRNDGAWYQYRDVQPTGTNRLVDAACREFMEIVYQHGDADSLFAAPYPDALHGCRLSAGHDSHYQKLYKAGDQGRNFICYQHLGKHFGRFFSRICAYPVPWNCIKP